MVEPTESDIGREIIYTANHPGATPEAGILTSFNQHYVFARYGSDRTAKGAKRENLTWGNEHATNTAANSGA